MSNNLAIATVSACFKAIIEKPLREFKEAARVTTVKPTADGNELPKLGVNLFLYQVTPNNLVNSNRPPKAELSKRGSICVDLYYLLTFYGDDKLLEPQKLLGTVVSSLVDYYTFSKELVRSTISFSNDPELAESNLAEQADKINVMPVNLSNEELSKIWSTLVQAPYTLCVAYQVNKVIIEGYTPAKSPLPIRKRQVYMGKDRPKIEWVVPSNGIGQPILTDSTLLIRGENLNREHTRVQINKHRLIPQEVTKEQITLSLSEVDGGVLRAGMNSLQVVHLLQGEDSAWPDLFRESNVFSFVLCPTVVGEVKVENIQKCGKILLAADLIVERDLQVDSYQRVRLLLNQIPNKSAIDRSSDYIFEAKPRSASGRTVVFPISGVEAGEYLVRVKVDGAESLLQVDSNSESSTIDRYVEPLVTIRSQGSQAKELIFCLTKPYLCV